MGPPLYLVFTRILVFKKYGRIFWPERGRHVARTTAMLCCPWSGLLHHDRRLFRPGYALWLAFIVPSRDNNFISLSHHDRLVHAAPFIQCLLVRLDQSAHFMDGQAVNLDVPADGVLAAPKMRRDGLEAYETLHHRRPPRLVNQEGS
ncbi:hypothetical protein [Desulfonatronum thiodismutans]|uniref:hypothetical protein n=1 Tax=Desulfonatronum thiodismutans TaxID=159290 RepID=UPI000A0102F2|nr:hypothetical protein [Desulfonatronum thiodismutans]